MGVKSYVALDLSDENASVKDLLDSAKIEAKNDTIKLSDHVGALPANLTPRMASWYQLIAPERSAALDEVAAAYQVADPVSGAEGVFLRREEAKIRDNALAQKRSIEQNYRHTHQNLFTRIGEVSRDLAGSKRRYADLVSRHSREAKMTPKYYWLALAVIVAAETPINYEAFSAVRGASPAYALAITLITAALLGASAHIYGTFAAQYSSRFGAHAHDNNRTRDYTIFGLASAAFFVVLGAVGYARSLYLADILIENATVGGDAPSALSTIGGTLSANVIAWMLGVFVAHRCHDDDYRFPEAYKEKQGFSKKLDKLQKQASIPLRREFERIDANAEKEMQEARHRHNSSSHTEAFKAARSLEAAVLSQDARVVGVLRKYRSKLTSFNQNGDGIVFRKHNELAAEESQVLTSSDYASEPIELKYI